MAQSGMSFNVVDVETANEDRASICQIGLVKVRDGEVERNELEECVKSLMDKYGVELSALDWEGLEGQIKSLMDKYHDREELSEAEMAEIEEHLKALMDKYNISREQAVDKIKAEFDSLQRRMEFAGTWSEWNSLYPGSVTVQRRNDVMAGYYGR